MVKFLVYVLPEKKRKEPWSPQPLHPRDCEGVGLGVAWTSQFQRLPGDANTQPGLTALSPLTSPALPACPCLSSPLQGEVKWLEQNVAPMPGPGSEGHETPISPLHPIPLPNAHPIWGSAFNTGRC